MTLSELQPGEAATVLGYAEGSAAYRHQLMSMGLTPRSRVVLVRAAPFGDPIQIRVRNSALTLRKREASVVMIERCSL